MKASALVVTVFTCFLAGVASAQTFTVTAQGEGGVTSQVEVPLGSTPTIEIHGHLTTTGNQGLAFFSYDLRVNGPNPVNLSTAAVFDPPLIQNEGPGGEQPDVTPFHVLDGFNIWINQDPAQDLFNGAPNGDILEQLGGGQNTINNDPLQAPFIPFPTGDVLLNVAHGDGIIMHKFELTLPASNVGDIYTVEPFNVVANAISAFDGVNYTVDPVPVTNGVSVELVIVDECADTTAPEVAQAQAAPGETTPCTSYIDPRLESDNGVDLNQGVTEVTFVFTEAVRDVADGPLTTANFVVSETGGGVAPTVTSVTPVSGTTYTLTLSRPPTLQEWTTIQAVNVEDAGCGENPILNLGDLGPGVPEPDRIDIAALPGDINQDFQVTPQDLINLRQFLTAGTFSNDCADILYFDIDRDGVMPEPQDLLRFRQMISGTSPATRNWTLESLNNVQP